MSLLDRTLEGRRIELVSTDDPYTKLKRGDKGTIRYTFDNLGDRCIQINWDSGSNLALIEGRDSYKILGKEDEEGYIPREGEENTLSLCDACGQMKLIHHKHESGMLVCDRCWELFFF